MSRTIKFIYVALDILVPRFVKERVAVNRYSETQVITVCAERDITKDTVYTEVLTRTCFNFFGLGLFMKYYEDENE